MSKDRKKRIHLVYGCITAALVVAVGIALALSCIHIYRSGDQPFSTASIALHFQRIAPLVWLCLAAILGGFLLPLFLPCETGRIQAIRDSGVTLSRLTARLGELTAEERAALEKEQRLRTALRIGTGVLIAVLWVYPLIYCTDSAHFTISDLTQDILSATVLVLVTAALSLGLGVLCVYLTQASIRREITVCKQALASRPAAAPAQAAAGARKQPNVWGLRCAVFLIAVLFIVLGVFNDGIADVLGKAIRICTECIGLG